jgi:hypothetical protein
MCAVTVAVVGAVAGAAASGYSAYSQQQQQSTANKLLTGGSTETQLKGFAPTKGLQSYLSRIYAMNATATRPSLQTYAESGSKATFPMNDPGMTPAEAADIGMVDPHSGMPTPFVSPTQTQLTPAQQVFLGQQRARQGATGPLAQYGMATAKEKNLRTQLAGAGTAQTAVITGKLAKVGTKVANMTRKLQSGQ